MIEKQTEYKKCKRLENLTPQIIREWNNTFTGEIYLVKRQTLLRCPKTDELVPEHQCIHCPHYFGQNTDRWIYCLPDTERNVGVRSRRKKEHTA